MYTKFKEAIKKTIISCNNCVEIYSKNKKYKGYALFKKLTKNLEQYFDICEPDEIGLIKTSTYSVWLVSNEKLNDIDYLIYKNITYRKLYEKYRDETGCYELILIKKEQEK